MITKAGSSASSAANFVGDFTTNDLPRHLRSTQSKSDLFCVGPDGDICIQEVTTATFHEVVMNPGKVSCS